MKYFKNAELARLYNVSEKSVRNWIVGAEHGKIDLELYIENGKTFVADSVHNDTILLNFTERAKKYRNKYSFRKLEPSEDFYRVYTPRQIAQIASELATYREAAQQFRYVGEGGIYWSTYLHKLYGAKNSNTLGDTIKLLDMSSAYILDHIAKYDRVNLVDLGVGNGLAVKSLLGTLQGSGKLNKYIGIDISPELLAITQHNIEHWFNGEITFQGHVLDLNNEKFGDIIAQETYDGSGQSTINIVTLLGGTIPNFRDYHQGLGLIRDSLNTHDILLSSMKVDTPVSRRFFDFNVPAEKNSSLPVHHRRLADLLNIDPSLYDVEQLFDPNLRCRFSRIKLKVDLSLAFNTETSSRTVEFEKGERIILWRCWHFTPQELIEAYNKAGLKTLQSTLTSDENTILIINKVKGNHYRLE